MSLPRLVGAQVALVPTPHAVAVAVCAGEPVAAALAPLVAAQGWPHADTAAALRALAEHGRPGDDGGWLVVEHGEVVGECGWRGGPDADGEVEVLYGLAPARRGRGLATEAVGVLVAWAETRPGVRRVTARVEQRNEASRAVLRRLGFVEEPDAPPWVRCVRERDVPGVPLRVRGRHVC